jgi:uncharacterized membrane protein YcaP (DUF421 family)
MWQSMLAAGIPYGEKAVRTVVVYLVVVIVLRLAGKRELAQLNNFDLVVMLLLSNVVQNAIIGPDDSVSGAAFGAAVLIATNALLVRAAHRFPWLDRFFEGGTEVVARDGRYDRRAIQRLGLRRADVDVAIRKQGGDGVEETALVTLEQGGTMLVRLSSGDQGADKDDMRRITLALARIEARLDDMGANRGTARDG